MADDDPPPPGTWDPADLGSALARWGADASARDAAAARTRERWLRQQAGEAATLTGVLVDLAERGQTAAVSTRSATHTGRVVGVGRDFCVVSSQAAVIVALSAVVSVAPAGVAGAGPVGPGLPAPAQAVAADGDRPAPLDLDLEAVLALLAADRSPVRLVLDGGAVVVGRLWATGDGIVGCRLEEPGRRLLTVVSAAVASITPT